MLWSGVVVGQGVQQRLGGFGREVGAGRLGCPAAQQGVGIAALGQHIAGLPQQILVDQADRFGHGGQQAEGAQLPGPGPPGHQKAADAADASAADKAA